MNRTAGRRRKTPRALRGALSTELAAAGVVVLCACGDPAARMPPEVDVTTAVARNSASGAWRSGEAWRLVEELRIGAVAGSGPDVFGDVPDVDLDSAGRLFVVDRLAREVRVFDTNGGHIRSFGGAGAGPGEFQQPTGIRLRPDGTVWVTDLSGNGYTVFDTTGTFLRTYAAVGGQALPWRGGFDDAGRFYDWGLRLRGDGTGESLLIAYRVAEELIPVDTIVLPYPDPVEMELPRGNSIRMPFGAITRWQLDPRGYLWTGRNSEYRIVQVTLSGDTVRVIEKAHEPVGVTRAEAAAQLERLAPSLERIASSVGGSPPQQINLPEYRPAYDSFMTDERGYLWVELTLREDHLRTPGVPARYDVFDPDGNYLGEVTSPIPLWRGKPAFRGGYLAGVVTDSLGVDYVVRARIERPN